MESNGYIEDHISDSTKSLQIWMVVYTREQKTIMYWEEAGGMRCVHKQIKILYDTASTYPREFVQLNTT